MPTQPPKFRPVHTAPAKPWARPRFHKDNRKRGRAGQRERAEILAAEPLCRPCLAAGRVTEATQVDHVRPLSQGGTDDRGNKQPICKACHRAKTAAESAAGRAGPPTP